MIQYSYTQKSITETNTFCVVVPVFEKTTIKQTALKSLIKKTGFEAKPAQTQIFYGVAGFAAQCVMIVGLGKRAELTAAVYQRALSSLMQLIKSHRITSFTLPEIMLASNNSEHFVTTAVRMIEDSLYQINKPYQDAPKQAALRKVCLQTDCRRKKAIDVGRATAQGMALTRHLGDLPSNICTPSYLAKQAQDLAKQYDVECEILEEKEMAKLGMGALLSVSKGSIEKPKLICIHYRKRGNTAPIILLGKGVTFDSGGISLKPGAAMDEMKYDMCGSASVIGAMKAICELNPNINVSAVVAAVENMPAGNASKPGDVVQTMSGQTVEILNTDAEGRLILCDALTYCAKFKPKAIVDVATLTGAVIIALGKVNSGLMTNNQPLADALLAAASEALDGAWQLPLSDEYDELLKSNFADMANIGGREAGSITAGCFLARFSKDYPWAHLDIAGTAWVSGANKGATGRPVPLLVNYVMNNA